MTAPGNSAIHHAGGDVSVVVLDGDPLDALQRAREAGRPVTGVEIVGDDLR
jgi:hypothetical protein